MQISGNEKNLNFLKESADGGRLSHAYLISGPSGSGKKTFAENAAAALLCTGRKPGTAFVPCGRCPSCTRALAGSHPDIIRLTHEKKNTFSVDEIRRQLVQDIDIKPYYGPYKIYISEDASLMTPQAHNAILKTFEEPPAYAVIFLLADNADILPDTIKSRCIRLEMQLPEASFTQEELKKKGAGDAQARALTAFCEGNTGRALSLYENRQASEDLAFIISLLSDIKNAGALKISDAAKTLSESSLPDITDALRKWYHDILLIKACGGGRLYFPDERKVLFALSDELSYEAINRIFTDIEEASERLLFNVNAKAVYEALLLRIRRDG